MDKSEDVLPVRCTRGQSMGKDKMVEKVFLPLTYSQKRFVFTQYKQRTKFSSTLLNSPLFCNCRDFTLCISKLSKSNDGGIQVGLNLSDVLE